MIVAVTASLASGIAQEENSGATSRPDATKHGSKEQRAVASRGSLAGYEPLRLPEVPTLLAVPVFEPLAPQGNLALFTAVDTEPDPRHPHGAWSGLVLDPNGKLRLEERTRFPLPEDYAKRLERLSPDLGTAPVLGQQRRWVLTVGGLAIRPLWVQPEARLLAPFQAALQGARSPASTDLDRDGAPELWWFPPGGPERSVAAPLLSPCPGTKEPDRLGSLPWLGPLTGARSIRCFDLDEDLFEELIVLRSGGPIELLRNASDLDMDPVQADVELVDRAERRFEATELRLGPVRGDLQWALAFGGELPVLLARPVPGLVFEAHPRQPVLLESHRILDARILDRDGDADEELLVLVATDDGPELMYYDLPGRKDGDVALVARGLVVPGATALRVGDLDGDGGPDLVVACGRKAPLLLRAIDHVGPRGFTLRATLEGPDDQPHAIGASLDLLDPDDDTRFVRYRWPPQDTGDQPMLFLSWAGRESAMPRLRVTWSDGNIQELERLARNGYRFIKR